MPEALRVLGQSAPLAITDTDLYTVPAATSAVASTLAVCNRGTVDATFRVAVRPAGALIANPHYIYYETLLGPSSTIAITIGMTLAATDVVTVRSSTADLSFSLFGTEVS